MDPIELCPQTGSIGCAQTVVCGVDPCGTCPHDEVTHAALVPTGPHAGQVMLWTRCDDTNPSPDDPDPRYNPNFATYFWDPVSSAITGNTFFPSGAAYSFCSGHTWVLDEDREPRLFTVGGSPLSNRAYWFDPALGWNPPGDDPVDVPANGLYYPSVFQYGNDAASTSMVGVLGGTHAAAEFVCTGLYKQWWESDSGLSAAGAAWSENTSAQAWFDAQVPAGGIPNGRGWFQYPRPIVLSSLHLITPGHVVTCEDEVVDPAASLNWGNVPVHVIDLAQGQYVAGLPNLDPNVLFQNGFPMGSHQPLRGWNYCNAVIQHTLKPGWVWPADPLEDPLPTTQANALAQYDLDRVFVFGGMPKLHPDLFEWQGHRVVLELQGASTGAPSGWTWSEKARPLDGRMLGNWVLLPNGSVLAIGGQTENTPDAFLATCEAFDPGLPSETGSWKTMHSRLPPEGAIEPVPRGYHSVGMLVPSGEVILAGGQYFGLDHPNSEHVLEVFRPPYAYQSSRPNISVVPASIHYPGFVDDGQGNQVFDRGVFEVGTAAPQTIARACLIGVGSVTHHFDYGQRYIELMARVKSGAAGTVEVFPPAKAALAPPGYYLLFLVDENEVPSTGRLVKLDYPDTQN